ncbi:MAG TPA: hypothetical protein VGL73_14605 [Caulobacteraceae bacterium]
MPPAAILFDLDDTVADRAAALRRYGRFFAEDFGDQLPDELPGRRLDRLSDLSKHLDN